MQPSWTDVWGFWVDVVGLVVNVLLLFAAAIAGWAAVHALRAAEKSANAAEEASKQMKQDSTEQTRPYVFVEVIPGLGGPHSFDLRITNSGKSAARNLTLDADPWPDLSRRTYFNEHNRVSDAKNLPMLRTLFETPRILPPGCSIRTVWSSSEVIQGASDEVRTEVMLMDAEVRVTARYSGEAGSYVDEFPVGTHNAGLWPVPASGPTPSSDPATRNFYDLGRAIARAIGEISR